jgi:enamine deaminase RidA (YjgF/YER057c/UK114 family)
MSITRHDENAIMSKVVEHNGVVHVAGNTADDNSVGMKEQTAQVLAKIDGYLAQGGTDKTKLLTALIFISDMSKKSEMNEAWSEWIVSGCHPTRACVVAELGSPETMVEIIVSAAK